MGPYDLKGEIGIEPSIEEVTPWSHQLAIPLFAGVALEETGVSYLGIILKNAFERITCRSQKEISSA
jgi:hypothetical protein